MAFISNAPFLSDAAKLKNIYVVMGATGEYSDRREWPVMAYENVGHAKAHLIKAQERANEIYANFLNDHIYRETHNEFNPKMEMEYTGTSYFLHRVALSPVEAIFLKEEGGEAQRLRMA